VSGVGPRVHRRLGHATPPGLIREPQRPVAVLLPQSDQAVTPPFFRAYAGSGLVIQCLARSQLTPKRSRVCRMVSPLTCVATLPVAQLTSAASAKVHTLVGLPTAPGVRGTGARGRMDWPAPRAKRVRLARDEPVGRAGSPVALKACRAPCTVWSSMPKDAAMRGARSLRALANRIWHRRKTKASGER